MAKRVKRYVKRKANGLLAESVQEIETKVDLRIDDLARYVEQKLDGLDRKIDRISEVVTSVHDDSAFLARELYKLRARPDYESAFQGKPLISVRIATYNRADLLIERAISSVLKQTYQNFEIVVVGDHCTDDTEEKLKKIGDKRIKFYNLPNRTVYPEERTKKWMVIGAPAMNQAAAMAKGKWIAPLDDDDEFSSDHLEKLLAHAQKTKSELTYGSTNVHFLDSKKKRHFFAFPPEKGQFTFIGAIYMKLLDDIFKYDFHSWAVDEVADWNLIRRMMESGVRISAIEDVVGDIYLIPTGHKTKDY
jgi:glycosyltransferase involved in cell wall biosynthesis